LLKHIMGRFTVLPRSLDAMVSRELKYMLFRKFAAQRFMKEISCFVIENICPVLRDEAENKKERKSECPKTNRHGIS